MLAGWAEAIEDTSRSTAQYLDRYAESGRAE